MTTNETAENRIKALEVVIDVMVTTMEKHVLAMKAILDRLEELEKSNAKAHT